MESSTRVTSRNQPIDQLQNQSENVQQKKNTGTLGKDEFLQLLVTQLKYQDPLKPMDDKEFIGQMAQFSALEQMQNLNSSFSMTKALNLVGKYVVGKIVKDDKEQEVKGDVDSVKMIGNKAFAVVDGQDVAVDDISEVKERSDLQNLVDLSKYTGFIGKNVDSVVKGIKDDEVYQLKGNVKSISTFQDQPIVFLNDVVAKIDALVLNEEETAKVTTVKEYLQNNLGEVITAVAVDDEGKKTRITGKVSSVDGDDSKPQVIFDEVATAVDSIYKIY